MKTITPILDSINTSTHYGATPSEWHWLDLGCGLTADLLPVVSNPHARLSPKSAIKALGKLPSLYNSNHEVVGIKGWTQFQTTDEDIAYWSKCSDYGICVQTRRIRAVDVDVDDRIKAAEIKSYIDEFFLLSGLHFPVRSRANSGKFLIPIYVNSEVSLKKRILRLKDDRGLIEFLADGQQFVACGTHSSGARYEWHNRDGEFPTLTLDQFEFFWESLQDNFAVSDSETKPASHHNQARLRGPNLDIHDPLISQLDVLGVGSDGQIYITCPWKGSHSMDSGDSETCYFPAGTNGYKRGHFKCLHGHCENRSDADFMEALGIGPLRVFDPRNHKKLAEAIIDRCYNREKGESLVCHRGIFYSFTGSHYSSLDMEQLSAQVWKILGEAIYTDGEGKTKPVNPSHSMVKSVLNALKAVTLLPDMDAPFWLEGEHSLPAREYISMRNGIFHVPTRTLSAHTWHLFTTYSLPFSWLPNADTPSFNKFLHSVWAGDKDSQELLGEVFGYILAGDTRQQKIFLMLGPKRSGKGTLARVLEGLLGKHNIVTPTLQSLTSNFGLWPLLDKPLILIPDARLGRSDGRQVIVERFLNISGEDSMTVDRKHERPWVGQLPGRIFIMTNEIPMLGDASGALASRFVTLVMKNTFIGKEDIGLRDRLLSELPGIFRWALDGYERLKARGYFQIPQASQDAMREFSDLNNPLESFVREFCVVRPDLTMRVEDFRVALNSWQQLHGLRVMDPGSIGRALFAAFPQIGRSRPGATDARSWHYRGLQLNTAGRNLVLNQFHVHDVLDTPSY